MNMQLASKMRFVSAQLDRAARVGPVAAQRPARQRHGAAAGGRRAGPARVTITQAVQANAVFAILDRDVAERLRARFRFYDWNAATGEVRWMCSFDTTEADVDAFAAALVEELAAVS